EATPLAIDGVIYVSTAWSIVKAFDAKTGALLWSYDPAVPRALGVNGCCDVVSRGVAAWKGKIFVATFDGRLVALDARTGKPVWTVMTVDPAKPYSITQAPRVVKGRVVIGNSGGGDGRGRCYSRHSAAKRRARLALLHRAGRSFAAIREPSDDRGRQDLGWGVVEIRRRRSGVGRHIIRPRAQSHLFRRRQRHGMGPGPSQRQQGRQLVSVL